MSQGIASWRQQQRQRLTGLRNAVSNPNRKAFDAAMGDGLNSILQSRAAGRLAVYWPLPGEPDLRRWYESDALQHQSLALPVVVARHQPLKFRRWRPGDALGHDIMNIPCPNDDREVVPEIIVCPCVGYDEHGFRLGSGGGYYDRTLPDLVPPPLMIGVAYECQKLPDIHPQPYDVPMDFVVTEKSILVSKARSDG